MNTIKQFSDLTNLIEQHRKSMFETNPFFKTISDDSLSLEQRMLFIPYMLFFTCGGPDVITLLMQPEKKFEDLNFIEKKVHAFINEDNFHYNFYLKDLETLGYNMDKFGSVNGVIRHVFAQEAIPVRKLVYSLSHYSRQHHDPLVRLTLCELIEAGLYDLFVTVYKKIIKSEDSPYADLDYFGDTHVHLEMNHTVTSWFSGNESDVADIEIPAFSGHLLAQAVEEIMNNFNEMYLAFHAIIMQGDTIFPEKYAIINLPPIHQVTNKLYSHTIDEKKSMLQESLHAMKHHKVFSMINSRENLATFMQWHVFAVWDFMSLIKRLQKDLTGSSTPWMPPQYPELARLINEIILGEESDMLPDGTHASHFDLYRDSMREIQASTGWIDAFIKQIEQGSSVQEALKQQNIPQEIQNFVNATLATVSGGNILQVLGSFFYGREDSIPEMFQNLLDSWNIQPDTAPKFIYYLQRHIELDADSHAPALKIIMDKLTGSDPDKIAQLLDSSIDSVRQRIKLWDALAHVLASERVMS